MTQDKSVTAKCIQEIRVGDTAYAAKTVTEADVMMFAMLSGDYAPQHVSAAFPMGCLRWVWLGRS